jgi:hypothetical protein
MSTQESEKIWYTRRDGVMRGPFTAENISRYILLGRIDLDDEVSQDRETWIVAGHLDSLLPAELKSQSSWDDYQKLVTAHMRSHVDNTLLCQHLLDKPDSSDRKGSASQSKRPVVLFVVLLLTMMFAWLSPIQS